MVEVRILGEPQDLLLLQETVLNDAHAFDPQVEVDGAAAAGRHDALQLQRRSMPS